MSSPVLITGGAGFIGTNLASRLLGSGHRITILDNLSRIGVERNVDWLQHTYGFDVELVRADVRDKTAVRQAVDRSSAVFHFAAQTAVTTSLVHPAEDFDVNARGTLNVLEAIRQSPHRPPVFLTSTNKVYGDLADLTVRSNGKREEPEDVTLRTFGFNEQHQLRFHSPYGCSKGTADQYVLDYAHSFGLKSVVFRMSCIYGPHQFGTEDQGWVAHFLISALRGDTITIYGSGRQVRDILYIDDLVDALLLAWRNIDKLSGEAFNIGGGPGNSISLLELLDWIGHIHGESPSIHFGRRRVGDQRFYLSDTRKFESRTGWSPKVGSQDGLTRLWEWLSRNLAERETLETTIPA